jgi:hypothetical protein
VAQVLDSTWLKYSLTFTFLFIDQNIERFGDAKFEYVIYPSFFLLFHNVNAARVKPS